MSPVGGPCVTVYVLGDPVLPMDCVVDAYREGSNLEYAHNQWASWYYGPRCLRSWQRLLDLLDSMA